MTNRVITLWYRPPELLLGVDQYGAEVDIWSLGCIFGELLSGKALFHGATEVEQIAKINKLLGFPSKEDWPDVDKLPHAHFLNKKYVGNHLRQHICSDRQVEPQALDLLQRMLCLNPARRIEARDALAHPYFTTGERIDSRLPWKAGGLEMLTNKRHVGNQGAHRRPGEDRGGHKRAKHR